MACIVSWIVLAGIWWIASSTTQCIGVWILGWFIVSSLAPIRNSYRSFTPGIRNTPWCLLCNEYIPRMTYFAKCSTCHTMYHDRCFILDNAQHLHSVNNCGGCNRPTIVFQYGTSFSHHLFNMILIWMTGCVLPVAGIYIVLYSVMTWWTNPDHLRSMETHLDQFIEGMQQDRANQIHTQINTRINQVNE